MASSLVRGKYVVCKVIDDGSSEIIHDGAVFQRDGEIIEVGRYRDLKARHEPDEEIGSADFVVIPGLVNAHHHMGLTPFQLGSPDMALEPGIFARWASRRVDPYLDTLYCALEMIESGITTVMHNQSMARLPSDAGIYESSARMIDAYEDAGMRVAFSLYARDQHLFTYEDDEGFLARLPAELRARVRAGVKTGAVSLDVLLSASAELVANRSSARTRILISPHNVHWCSDAMLLAIKEFAERHTIGIHIHLLETAYQKTFGDRLYGKTSLAHLEELGFLGPEVSCAHGVWLTESDFDILAGTGTMICHNPSSNLRLSSGIAPINRLLARGVTVALGIDEAGINDDNDILQEMRLAQKIHHEPGVGNTGPTSHQLLDMATRNGSKATLFEGETGTLEPGKRADMALVSLKRISEPYLHPDTNVVDALLYRGKGVDVDTVIVDGEVLLRGREFTKVNKAEVASALRDSMAVTDVSASEVHSALNKDLLPHVERWFAGQGLPGGSPHYRYNAIG